MSANNTNQPEENMECCICYDSIGSQNNCTTPCGHKFCFVCMMKSLGVNNTCPCCRAVLVEEEEEEEEEDDDDEYSDSDDDSSLSDYRDSRVEASAEKIADRLVAKGYTMADILTLYLRRLDSSNERTSREFIVKLAHDHDEIIESEDVAVQNEHREKFDMMGEDARRHSRPVNSWLEYEPESDILSNLFSEGTGATV